MSPVHAPVHGDAVFRPYQGAVCQPQRRRVQRRAAPLATPSVLEEDEERPRRAAPSAAVKAPMLLKYSFVIVGLKEALS